MQQTKNISFLKGDKAGSEVDYRDALPTNMSGIVRKLFDAKGYLLQTAGLTQYGKAASGATRGGVWNALDEEHYRVQGASLVKVDADGVVTVLGVIPNAGVIPSTPAAAERLFDSEFKNLAGCNGAWDCSGGVSITPNPAGGTCEFDTSGDALERDMYLVEADRVYNVTMTWNITTPPTPSDAVPTFFLSIAGGDQVAITSGNRTSVEVVAGSAVSANGKAIMRIVFSSTGSVAGTLDVTKIQIQDLNSSFEIVSADPDFNSICGVTWTCLVAATIPNGAGDGSNGVANNIAGAGFSQTASPALIEGATYDIYLHTNVSGGTFDVTLGNGAIVNVAADGDRKATVVAGAGTDIKLVRPAGDSGGNATVYYAEVVKTIETPNTFIDLSGDTVSMPYSFNTQGIVAGKKFYLYDVINGLVEVTDGDLGDPIDAIWIDGYYFFTDGTWLYHNDLDDESAIDPLKYGASTLSPDKTKGVARTQDNKVAVFSRYMTDYFSNVVTPQFAFSRISGRQLKAGIVGTHCKCELDGRFFIMGGRKEEDVSIHALSVSGIKGVSSREVDKVIGTYTEEELSGSVLESRSEKKYKYLIVHLPNEVMMLNLTIAKVVGFEHAWTIMTSDVYADVLFGERPWRAKHGIFEPRKGVFVYGDKYSGLLGVLDNAVSTQYGELVGWNLYTPFMYLNNASIDKLEIETISGYNSTDDASVAISMTFNGTTYSREKWIQYGQPSHYGKGFIANRLGHVEDWVSIKLRGASESRMAFSRAFIEYE